MFDRYVIEIDEAPAGIILKSRGGYTFHAVDPQYGPLEGVTFANAISAERAAMKYARRKKQPA